MLSPNPTSLRTHVSPDEMEILVFIASTGKSGYLLRSDLETPLHRFLVDDEFMTRGIEERTGGYTYHRYHLTDAGRKALCIMRPA